MPLCKAFVLLSWTVTILKSYETDSQSFQDNASSTTNRLRLLTEFTKPRICGKEDRKYEETAGDWRLVKLRGVKVGHVQDLKLIDGKTHKVITRSFRPLLFEIPEFLSPEECNHFIQLAQREHFEDSETVYGRGDGSEKAIFLKKLEKKNLGLEKDRFCSSLLRECYDLDRDGKVSLEEFILFLDREKYIYPSSSDAKPIFRQLDSNLDASVIRDECFKLNNTAFLEFLYEIEKLKFIPRYFLRFSESSWISTKNSGIPFVERLQDRIVKLTGLSKQLVERSEPIQIVRYSVFGHYNVHYDSTKNTRGRQECCKTSDYTGCHLCRFMTILLYLNDVAKGGETAFPVADDVLRYTTRNYSVTLNEKCREASLLIKPKKGTAVMWYNHFIEHDGVDYMGAIDRLSLHGGCDVIQGVKWIANIWLNAPLRKGGEV